jgi:hypothetical protein
MRQILALLLSIPFYSYAQLNSENTYYFQQELDTLFAKFKRKEFRELTVRIDMGLPSDTSQFNEEEIYRLKYLNDSLIDFEIFILPDSIGGKYPFYIIDRELFDLDTSTMAPKKKVYTQTEPELFSRSDQKDSLNYIVEYGFTISRYSYDSSLHIDTTYRGYKRTKFDRKKRPIQIIERQYRKAGCTWDGEWVMNYSGSHTSTTRFSMQNYGKRKLVYSERAKVKTDSFPGKKIIYKQIFVHTSQLRERSREKIRRTILYSETGTILSIKHEQTDSGWLEKKYHWGCSLNVTTK